MALRGFQCRGRRIELTYNPASAPQVREFVRRERQCCPFLAFEIRQDDGAVTVEIEAAMC